MRSKDIFDVFSHIRFSLIDKYYFFDRIKPNTLLQTDPRITQLLDEVSKQIVFYKYTVPGLHCTVTVCSWYQRLHLITLI